MIDIYTDGACDPNPGIGSYGFIVIENKKVIHESVTLETQITTNNRMEIKGLIEALKWSKKKENITIHCDSMYCVNIYNSWINKWKAKGWKRKKNKEIINLDLIKELYELKLDSSVVVKWIKGHSDHEFNDHIDDLVTSEVTKHYSSIEGYYEKHSF